MAQNGNVRIPGNAADPKRPVAKITGYDYSPIATPELNDHDANVTVKNAPRGPYGSGK